MPDSYLPASLPPVAAPDGLSVGEIAQQLRRRVDWYGLDGLTLRAVERQGDGHIVAELADTDDAVYREVIDGWTGRVRERAVVWQQAGVKAA